MAKIIAPLTATKVQSAKPKEKLYKLTDGGGLALWIYPSGNKSWKLSYRRNSDGKQDTLTLGSYPRYSLQDARLWREQMKDKLFEGEDLKKKITIKKEETIQEQFIFDHVLYEWLERWLPTVSGKYGLQVKRAIEANCLPFLTKKDIKEIKTFDIVQSLRPMEARGKLEYLRRTKYGLKLCFDDAVGQGLIESNPVIAIGNKVFKKHESKHFDALTPEQLPDLIKFLETGCNELSVRLAIYWQLLTMTRPSETTNMKWEELDLKNDQWIIPADRMKKKREHIVPISTAMKWILKQAQEININKVYVFEGMGFLKPISQETPRVALRRAGLPTTAHGLRSLARTYLREKGHFERDVLEMLLAHVIGSKTEQAYNRSLLLEERKEALEWWGNEILNIINVIQSPSPTSAQ